MELTSEKPAHRKRKDPLLPAHRRPKLTVGKGGWLFMMVGFIIFLAAYNTGNNLLYMVEGMMAGGLVVSYLLGGATLRRLHVQLRIPKHVFAKEAFAAYLIVSNTGRFYTACGVTTQNLTPDLTYEPRCLLKLSPGQRVEVQGNGRFETRGKKVLTGFRLATGFPFGLLQRSLVLALHKEVVVYPRLRRLAGQAVGILAELGTRNNMRKGESHDFYGLREYLLGDDARFISWKLSAKQSQLMVKEFTREERPRITLVFDNVVSDLAKRSSTEIAERDDEFEHAVDVTAALANHFVEQNYELELVTGSDHVPFGRGQEQLFAVLKTLALVQPVPSGEEQERFTESVKRRGDVLMVTLGESRRGNLPDWPGVIEIEAKSLSFAA